MSTAGKLLACGLPLLVVSVPGCAGGGLRNLVSRDETAGYRTLEQLEAEESRGVSEVAALEGTAGNEGPRFASWVPFVGSKAESPALASQEASAADDPEAAWWKNPFRKRGTAELDPFLTAQTDANTPGTTREVDRDQSTASAAAVSERGAEGSRSGALTGGAGVQLAGLDDRVTDIENVRRSAWETTQSAGNASAELEELLREAAEPASKASSQSASMTDDVDEAAAEPLIADIRRSQAGTRQAAARGSAAARKPSDAAESKLEELESLLQKRRGQVRSIPQEVADVARQSARRSAGNVIATARAATEENFDRMLQQDSESSAPEVVGRIDETATEFLNEAAATSREDGKVVVAAARSLFGNAVRDVVGQAGEVLPQELRDLANTDLSADALRSTGSRWASEQLDKAAEKVTGRTAQELDAAAQRIAGLLPAQRRAQDRSIAPRSVDGWQPAHESLHLTGSHASAFDEPDSNGEVLAASASMPVDSQDGLTADPFFNSPPVAAAAAPATAEAALQPAGTSAWGSWRTWVLLIGGIIVVALLFAPDRKSGRAPTTGTDAD